MSHCYICDKTIDEPKIDHRDLKPRPCSECEQVIQELVQSYQDEESNFTYIESDIIEFNEEAGATGQPDLDDT